MDAAAELERAMEEGLATARRGLPAGRVATYIPELTNADPMAVGVAVALPDGTEWACGQTEQPFTLQSIAKVLALTVGLHRFGPEQVFARVGMEPTGEPFNSIVKLEESAPDRPLNPMVNGGAIAICALLCEGMGADAAFTSVTDLATAMCHPHGVRLNERVFHSERETGHRNRALAYLLRELGMMHSDPEPVLDVYFRLCSLEVTCAGLAQLALAYAHAPKGRSVGISKAVIRTVNALLVTSGMYNGSGAFAVQVGLPAKSGVSGGIMAVVPNRMGIATYGPALDEKGNSVAGVRLLAAMSRRLDLSMF